MHITPQLSINILCCGFAMVPDSAVRLARVKFLCSNNGLRQEVVHASSSVYHYVTTPYKSLCIKLLTGSGLGEFIHIFIWSSDVMIYIQ